MERRPSSPRRLWKLPPRSPGKKLVQTRQALRDAVTTIDDQVIAGDRVWSRATSRGVNHVTSEPAVVTWIVVHRVERGRIAETWAATLAGTEWKPMR